MRYVIILFLMMGLSGCFIAPGMKMETPPETTASYAAAHEIQPNFIAINVDLIKRIKRHNRIRYSDNSYHYIVAPHDILNIYVWGHPEFNSPLGQAAGESGGNSGLNPSLAPSGFLVGPNGQIFYPIVGYIDVAGNTAEEIRTDLTQKLRRYIRKPQVDVRVIGFRSKKVYVMGEVNKPGIQPLTDLPLSITDVINLSGGMDPNVADPSHIFVIRDSGDVARPNVYWLNAHSPSALILAENFYLQPQDVVYVSTASVANWNRAISLILPSIQTLWMTYSLVSQFNHNR